MSGLVVDTSVWIDFLHGVDVPLLEDALARGVVVLPPIVIAELVSGARRPPDRAAIVDVLRDLAVHETRRDHWVRVGELRRALRERGFAISTPDAHVAQCAIDRDARLLSRDAVFRRVAEHSTLRLVA